MERLQCNEQNVDFIPQKNFGRNILSDFQRQYLNQFLLSNFYIIPYFYFCVSIIERLSVAISDFFPYLIGIY